MSHYVISDLHGQYEIFKELLFKINYTARDRLYVIGDAIDRGTGGIRILTDLMKMPNARMLIGNHEAMMLMSVDPGGALKLPGSKAGLWMYSNGGTETWEKYTELSLNERIRLLKWLNKCPLSVTVDIDDRRFLLTHSFYDDRYIGPSYEDIPEEIVWQLVWKSPFRWDTYVSLEEYQKRKETIIIGHVPVLRIRRDLLSANRDSLKSYREGNLVVIDGGCAMSRTKNAGGICLKLEDMSETAVSFEDVL